MIVHECKRGGLRVMHLREGEQCTRCGFPEEVRFRIDEKILVAYVAVICIVFFAVGLWAGHNFMGCK